MQLFWLSPFFKFIAGLSAYPGKANKKADSDESASQAVILLLAESESRNAKSLNEFKLHAGTRFTLAPTAGIVYRQKPRAVKPSFPRTRHTRTPH
jgi:hypothetical protein